MVLANHEGGLVSLRNASRAVQEVSLRLWAHESIEGELLVQAENLADGIEATLPDPNPYA